MTQSCAMFQKYFEMAYLLNVNNHKLSEMNSRLNNLLNKLLQELPEEVSVIMMAFIWYTILIHHHHIVIYQFIQCGLMHAYAYTTLCHSEGAIIQD